MDQGIENIISKVFAKEATQEELNLLESWRNDSEENKVLYKEFETIWKVAGDYEPVDFIPNTEKAYQTHLALIKGATTASVIDMTGGSGNHTSDITTETKIITPFFSKRTLTSIAALFIFALAALFTFNTVTSTTSIYAEEGIQFASLEDGSKIWLDEGSTLTYKKGFGTDHRNINLEGKAFFDVERNENLPFSITSDDINVSVLGTSFTVDGSNVAVKTGKVAVTSQENKVVITKNQSASLDGNTIITGVASANEAIWRNEELSFNSAPLAQVIDDINLHHDNKITLINQLDDDNCPFTAGGLAGTNFKDILDILKLSYDLEVKESMDDKVEITISDCK